MVKLKMIWFRWCLKKSRKLMKITHSNLKLIKLMLCRPIMKTTILNQKEISFYHILMKYKVKLRVRETLVSKYQSHRKMLKMALKSLSRNILKIMLWLIWKLLLEISLELLENLKITKMKKIMEMDQRTYIQTSYGKAILMLLRLRSVLGLKRGFWIIKFNGINTTISNSYQNFKTVKYSISQRYQNLARK